MDVRKLKDKASEFFAKGKFAKAAETYEELVRAEPKDSQLRVRLGDAYAKTGNKTAAIGAYQAAAEAYAREGFLPRSIAVCKLILELDPKHDATQKVLADLYARKTHRAEAPPPPPARREAATLEAPPPEIPTDIPMRDPAVDEDVPIELDLPQAGQVASERWRARAAPPPSDEIEIESPAEVVGPISSGDAPGGWNRQPAPAAMKVMPLARPAEEVATKSPQVIVPPPSAPKTVMPPVPELTVDAPITIDIRAPAAPSPPQPPPPAVASPPPLVAAWLSGPTVELDLDDAGSAQSPTPAPVASATPSLPEIPLFSDLPHDAFVALTSRCTLKRLERGEVVIAQGSVGQSFFVLCSGKVKVFKTAPDGRETVLAELGEGAFFGEMALLSGAPRAASVAATEDSEALEIHFDVLSELDKQFPTFANVLKKFCRQRLLSNLMATSTLFRPFDRKARKRLIERFRIRDVETGTTLVREGTMSEGLYVLMSGDLEVTKNQDGHAVPLARLREGDVFGEISLLKKAPATATVIARRRSTVLRLPREGFDEVASAYPQVLSVIHDLSDERLKAQEAILAGKVQSDEEGLFLV
jgi:CRP-like cAMP-binding protein